MTRQPTRRTRSQQHHATAHTHTTTLHNTQHSDTDDRQPCDERQQQRGETEGATTRDGSQHARHATTTTRSTHVGMFHLRGQSTMHARLHCCRPTLVTSNRTSTPAPLAGHTVRPRLHRYYDDARRTHNAGDDATTATKANRMAAPRSAAQGLRGLRHTDRGRLGLHMEPRHIYRHPKDDARLRNRDTTRAPLSDTLAHRGTQTRRRCQVPRRRQARRTTPGAPPATTAETRASSLLHGSTQVHRQTSPRKCTCTPGAP